ncbi:type III-B CRISPR module-associated protein Cmr3 [Paenibacillus taiwanensis]|uniref:type III-B CRISPR module-associated protein Cmr3 n=1 Tax=Paenibacillus taiwanensis TaxID=401638 RepID=UPI0004290D6F|nr:type III-B CRISPR module-associated protein Cmr3 [Paenibacillus taiwanensis]
MKKTLRIEPLDPLLIRDGRPFNRTPGVVARSTSTIAPSVVAGTLRTAMYKHIQSSCSPSVSKDQIECIRKSITKSVVRGPLHSMYGEVYYPFPQDVDVSEVDRKIKVHFRRPRTHLNEDEGFLGTDTNSRYTGQLLPVLHAATDKPWPKKPAFVSASWMTRWLADELTESDWETALQEWSAACKDRSTALETWNEAQVSAPYFLAAFEHELRTHTAIDEQTYGAKDEHLFGTEMLVLPEGLSLLAECDLSNVRQEWPEGSLATIHSMGGKKRLVHIQESLSTQVWNCPADLSEKMAEMSADRQCDRTEQLGNGEGDPGALRLERDGCYVRMVLATPAYFAKGWLPRWVNTETLLTERAGWLENVSMKLVWACLSDWQPVSGWSYTENKSKALRRMVPAGSVYFFQVMEGEPSDLLKRGWLRSVSDANRRKGAFDKEDGFGLAMWGLWRPNCAEK